MASRQSASRFSAAHDFLLQYPHQSDPRRAAERDSTGSASSAGSQPRTSISRNRDRSSKVNSVDTAIHIPSTETSSQYQTEQFRERYAGRRAVSRSEGTLAGKTMSFAQERPPLSPDFSDMDDGSGQPIATAVSGDPPQQGSNIPARTSRPRRIPNQPNSRPPSKSPVPHRRFAAHADAFSGPPSPDTFDESAFDSGARSSAGSVVSEETGATSIHTLPPLQTKGPDNGEAQHLEPVLEDDPRSWDLVAPVSDEQELGTYALEKRAEQLFSAQHLRTIFDDPKLLLRFTGFLNTHRPKSIPILIYYLDALKALRAINYANAIADGLEPIKGQGFTEEVAKPTSNATLEEKANRAFEVLVQEDLPAYVAYTWIHVVSLSIQRRITGTLAPHLREASEGLAEVFCLTDPSRTDNPIVFASEEFTRTTQYGMNYVIGRNCRFLQGPRTSPHSVRRLAIASTEGREHTEVLVNYRRDGSPFMNLLMTAPLMDSRGNVRYYIGAQVDVSGLIKDCSEMDGLQRLLEREAGSSADGDEADDSKDEFQILTEMFNGAELDTVRKFGGRMHKEYVDDSDRESLHGRPRLLLKDPSSDKLERDRMSASASINSTVKERLNGRLDGVYQHSPFLNRIGGSSRVRTDLRAALAEGRGVTAKIRWLTRPDEDGEGEGRPRWIHCTPLLGHSGAVGVWMVVLVDDEGSVPGTSSGRRFRQAPPVSTNIGGKEWDASVSRSRERRQLNVYDKENERRGTGRVEYFNRPGSRSAYGTRDPSSQRQDIATSANVSEFSFDLRN